MHTILAVINHFSQAVQYESAHEIRQPTKRAIQARDSTINVKQYESWLRNCSHSTTVKVKVLQALRVQEVKAPRFQDYRRMKVVKLSALHTSPL